MQKLSRFPDLLIPPASAGNYLLFRSESNYIIEAQLYLGRCDPTWAIIAATATHSHTTHTHRQSGCKAATCNIVDVVVQLMLRARTIITCAAQTTDRYYAGLRQAKKLLLLTNKCLILTFLCKKRNRSIFKQAKTR